MSVRPGKNSAKNSEKTKRKFNKLFIFDNAYSLDAKCSFGKSLFDGSVKDLKPSQVRFLKNSRLDITLAFGCSITVEEEPGKWVNFRSFFIELYGKAKLELVANDAAKRIKFNGDVDELKAVRIKIFKKDKSQVAEETALTMMINMGLNMAKTQAKNALDIPSIGYPTIKKCTGLTLLRPAINIYDGFVVFSTDLDVKPAEKNCDFLEPASVHEVYHGDDDQKADEGSETIEVEDDKKIDL